MYGLSRASPHRLRRTPRLIIVGAGDVGARLAAQLPRWRVFGVRRSRFDSSAMHSISADLTQRQAVKRFASLATWAVYLAPPATASGLHDVGLRNFLLTSQINKLTYVSTSGVYGDAKGGWISETAPRLPDTGRGVLRLNAENQLRAYTAARAGLNPLQSAILRAPGIYAANRLPLERLTQGLPALIESEDSFSNHIHADDLARLCKAALLRGKGARSYHASDNLPLKMGDYFDAVAQATGLPKPPRLPAIEAKAKVSAMQWSFMQSSKRLRNDRLAELRQPLQYPTVLSFVAKL